MKIALALGVALLLAACGPVCDQHRGLGSGTYTFEPESRLREGARDTWSPETYELMLSPERTQVTETFTAEGHSWVITYDVVADDER